METGVFDPIALRSRYLTYRYLTSGSQSLVLANVPVHVYTRKISLSKRSGTPVVN